ncbi:Metalloprotease [Auriculariales sp. MPI-PUGE-AT-0066]|nr:Metalloprotease [Auriculariales sp. MPI-PUGE-AT-0066]
MIALHSRTALCIRVRHFSLHLNLRPSIAMTSKLQAPQPPPRWNHTPAEVAAEIDATITAAKSAHDRIAALPKPERTFDSVFGALAAAEAAQNNRGELLAFYQNVAPSKELRDASETAEVKLKDYKIESSMRVDLFEAAKDAQASAKGLTGEDERLAEKIVLEGKRNGLDLPEDKRKRLEALNKELSALCVKFQKNCNEENGRIEFTAEELAGVPEDVISGYSKTDSGSYSITFKTPDIMPLAKFAKSSETRRRAWCGYEARTECNTDVFSKMLDLRRQIVELLGYNTWADYITEVKMAKSGDNVIKFITDLENKLRPLGEKDRATLLALKKQEEGTSDDKFYVWDWYFYDRLQVERSLSLDEGLVKEYFPVDVVVPTILGIYQDLLGVDFVQLSNDVEKGDVWHPEVQRFAVWEAGAKDASGFIGYTYLDLYPRDGKYGHAAVWGLVAGYEGPNGERNYPVTAMAANLAKPTPDRPALMTHDNVVTFFHEMGHVFHGLLSTTKYSRFHGTEVARDFVEAPSQMLENWCWVPKVLSKMSSHYKTKEPLSDELIEKIIKSRYVNIGMFMLRQIFFGKFDITVHTDKKPQDYTELWSHLREHTSLVLSPKPLIAGQASFAHLAGGYDAGYYGYAYSLVFAADMFAQVFKEDPMSPAAGAKYRREILNPGGSRDEIDSLKAFLGREPNANAFIEQIMHC